MMVVAGLPLGVKPFLCLKFIEVSLIFSVCVCVFKYMSHEYGCSERPSLGSPGIS